MFYCRYLLFRFLLRWKKDIEYDATNWVIDVPAKRKTLKNLTFEVVNLLFFQQSTTRSFYLMDFRINSLPSVQMWRIWLAHNLIEQFWAFARVNFETKASTLDY